MLPGAAATPFIEMLDLCHLFAFANILEHGVFVISSILCDSFRMAENDQFVLQNYSLENALPYLLNRAGVRIGEAFSKELEKFDITLPMWRVLASLLHEDGQRMTQLAEHTSIEISTLSRLVAGLEKKGLMKRKPSEDDRRSVIALLTRAGRNLAAQVAPLADLYERIALANISAEDAVLLKRLLRQIYTNISSLGPQVP
jgi:DNA-binding MarR family transcriptional regulator